jgi:micrococcal nuclease
MNRLFLNFPADLAAQAPFGPYRSRVLEWLDGDTVVALADLGFYELAYVEYRVEGINSPEVTGTTREAGEAAQRQANTLAPVDSYFIAYTDRPIQRRSFTRWVAILVLPGSRNFGRLMVESGFATQVL